MARRRKIGPTLIPTKLSEEEQKAFEEHAGLGKEFDRGLEDRTWMGTDGTIDRDRLIKDGLHGENALRALVERLVQAHPAVDSESQRSTKKTRSFEADRVDRAMDAIVGRRPKQGRPRLDLEKLSSNIARRYAQAFFIEKPSIELDTIIREEMQRAGWPSDLDAEERSNAIAPIRAAFKPKLDVLVFLATGDGQDALQERDDIINQIMRLLLKVGVPAESK